MACVQSVAMFGSGLRWRGGHICGTISQVNELRLLVSREAGETAGCYWPTNPGALSMEAGLRAAITKLENRLRRFGLWPLSRP